VSTTPGISQEQARLVYEFWLDMLEDKVPSMVNLADRLMALNLPEDVEKELIRCVRGMRKGAIYVAENMNTIDEQLSDEN